MGTLIFSEIWGLKIVDNLRNLDNLRFMGLTSSCVKVKSQNSGSHTWEFTEETIGKLLFLI